jgi:hypothetical protein
VGLEGNLSAVVGVAHKEILRTGQERKSYILVQILELMSCF